MGAPEDNSTLHRILSISAVAIGFSLLSITAAFTLQPALRHWLTTEDNLLENATALAFLAAATVGMWALNNSHWTPRIYWLVPACGLFGFLEELSYGHRLLGWEEPVVMGIPIDSAHDVFDLAARAVYESDFRLRELALIAVLPLLLAAVLALRQGRAQRIRAWFQELPPIGLLSVTVALGLFAVAIDVTARGQVMTFVEEVAEFAGACVLLTGAFAISAVRDPAGPSAPGRKPQA